MATRVYEIAKKMGISPKELVQKLHDKGFEVSSHMAVFPEEALPLFEEKTSTPITSEKSVEASEQKNKEDVVYDEVSSHPISIKSENKHMTSASPEAQAGQIELKTLTVSEMADAAHKTVGEVILTLLKQGIVAAKNQLLPEKTVEQLAGVYGLTVIKKKSESTRQILEERRTDSASVELKESRMPIIVVIGHVDHGKTTLLDFIRKTRVAAKEKGGITQHLGAYEVLTDHGTLVFLDTPGHEAFTLMRGRGIKIADIAILVVAADDGIMPQTKEAIERAKIAQVPVIVAINKIDKATPQQIEVVKRQLAQLDMVPEDWGGKTICVPISAKMGTGIDNLLEIITLQAQIMELTARVKGPALGYILESKIEKGRGPVATVIPFEGTISIGDYFQAGIATGRVSSLVDSHGRRVTSVGPSVPVQIAGFDVLPRTGDTFEVMSREQIRKGTIAEVSRASQIIKSGNRDAFNLIIKADNASSLEALTTMLSRFSDKKGRELNVIHAAVGDMNESDVMLALDTGALLIGLHVKADHNALVLSQREKVAIKLYDIIYKLLEDIDLMRQHPVQIKMVQKKVGEAVVLKIFDIKNLGIIAGAVVKTGRFVRDGKVSVWRGKQRIGHGAIKSLQRDKKTVKEIHAGFECAFLVDGFDAWEVDDRVECFAEVPSTE